MLGFLVLKLPVVATEVGRFWQASKRYQREWQIVESVFAVDAQVNSPFALIDDVDEWTTASSHLIKFHPTTIQSAWKP